VDRSELAKMMLQWEKLQNRADELKAAIVDSVLQLEETVTAGNVKATYYRGRKSYDYSAVGQDAPQALKDKYTEAPAPKTDWRKLVVEGMGIDASQIPFTQSDPSVSLRIQ
jgi:hypothetical protein